jgi:release factor glutamine methyltransferase
MLTECNPAAPGLLREVLRDGERSLAQAGITSARLDAEVLLAFALGLTREQLIASPSLTLGDAQVRLCYDLLMRRVRREPVAYILGRQEFWSLDFQVARDVLIPRPETERLVEIGLDIAERLAPTRPLRVLDIGTGSGAIAISLATELRNSTVWATDVSSQALAIARVNAQRHQVEKRIHFLEGDLWAALNHVGLRFDLILSNPPYIPSAEIDALESEVSRWEPRGALDGGVDGLDFYRRIASRAHSYLAPDGALALEIGADMGEAATKLFADGDAYTGVQVFCDYAGRDRVIVARLTTHGYS